MTHFIPVAARISRSGDLAWLIQDARQHWSAEALAKRAANRTLYMDTKYPEGKVIVLADPDRLGNYRRFTRSALEVISSKQVAHGQVGEYDAHFAKGETNG